MNKTTINAINNYTKKFANLNGKYVKYKGKCIITDKYSIVALNDIPKDYIISDNKNIYKFFDDFSEMEVLTDINFEDLKEYKSEKINGLYYIQFNIDEVKSILKILKKSTIKILNNKNKDIYVLKLENKNGEVAYILPIKVF